MPEITIITPLFNGAPHIADCIASVAAQNISDIEHLVVDNRSTDAGPEIVRRTIQTHPHLRLLTRDDRQGAAAARNTGLDAAKSRWVAFLDADDRFLAGKLARQTAAMQERDLAFSWTGYRVLKNGQPRRNQPAYPHAAPRQILHKQTVIGCSTVILDRDALGHHRFDETLPLAEDFALWCQIAQDCAARGLGIGGVPDILTLYSATGGVSRHKWRAAKGHWLALRRGLDLSLAPATHAMASYIRHALRDRLR